MKKKLAVVITARLVTFSLVCLGVLGYLLVTVLIVPEVIFSPDLMPPLPELAVAYAKFWYGVGVFFLGAYLMYKGFTFVGRWKVEK